MKIAIVLASYNGARYIEEQIRSIQSQSVESWSLLVRDDGSTDDTAASVARLSGDDRRIIPICDDHGRLGAIQNFAELMRIAQEDGADYVFFADQDDVWHPQKLQIFLDETKRLAMIAGKELPLLLHSDLEVVNDSMETISPSFMKYVGLAPGQSAAEVLLCQNVVTGCACMINRALLDLALPVPEGVIMHDWWLAVLAVSAGRVAYIERPLVRYRQHGENVVGAEAANEVGKFMYTSARWRRNVYVARQSIIQAGLLAQRLRSRDVPVRDGVRELIGVYEKLLTIRPLWRPSVLRKHKIHKQAVLSDMLFEMAVMAL